MCGSLLARWATLRGRRETEQARNIEREESDSEREEETNVDTTGDRRTGKMQVRMED